jgi:general bacterial porin, GBP family
MRLKLISQGVMGATFAMAAGTACAQTSVTLYGVADTFFQYLNNGGTASVSQRSGGSTGSMFGMKGSEDLGGGLKANFVLENGYNINNGSGFADTTALFYRQAWVGFAHENYGSLTFGRQYQPSFRAVYPSDPFHANEVLSPLSAAVLATDRNTLSAQYAAGRTSNSILYVSPKLAGFQFNAMYGFAATVTQPVPATTGNILDISATYTGYGLFVGLAYMNEHAGVETVPGLPSALTLVGTEHYTAAMHTASALSISRRIIHTRARRRRPRTRLPPSSARRTRITSRRLARRFRPVRSTPFRSPAFSATSTVSMTKRWAWSWATIISFRNARVCMRERAI